MSKMFLCKLVGNKNRIIESFYREGEDEQSVLKGLEMFQWEKGKWVITDVNNRPSDNYDYIYDY